MGGIMSIILQGSTSGSITLQEPAVSGSTVLTLPAVSGTVLTTTSPKAGNVLQVVSQQAPANYTSTSSALTLLTQSFTPTSASSKVLALMSYTVERNGGGSGNYIFVSFLRNGSTIVSNWGNATGYQESSGARGIATHTYLDSPATTSAISYTIVGDFSAGGAGVPWQFYTFQLTLMEIAA